MKIYIPFQIKDIGGTSTFAHKFSRLAAERGHTVTFDFCLDFDRMLVIADAPLWNIVYAKLKGIPIIQRLDGVYHPGSGAGRLHWIYNLKMRIIYNLFADMIIFQSRFSQVSCQKFLGRKLRVPSVIIYNGVHIPRKEAGNQLPNQPIRLVTFSKFRRLDQIEPILKSLECMTTEYSLTIYGTFSENLSSIVSVLQSNPNIEIRDKLTNDKLLKEINRYDIFLFSDQSACPNSVLEALAASLPIVAFRRGSIDEIVNPGVSGEMVTLTAPEPFTNPFPFQPRDYRRFAQSITRVSANLSRYKSGARQSAIERFKLDQMVDGYFKVIIQ